MHISFHAMALWLADTFGTALVLFLLFRLRLARRWPSIAALLSSDLLAWVVLALIHHHYRYYYYAYWSWQALDYSLRLWVLADCLRSIPGTGIIPTNARLMALTLVAGMAVACGIWAFHVDGASWTLKLPNHTTAASVELDAILLYNRAACFASLAFTAGALASVAIPGFGWERTSARMVTGLSIDIASIAFRSAAWTDSQTWLHDLAYYSTNLSHLAVLAIWIFAILGSRKPNAALRYPDLPTPPTSNLQRRVLQHI